MEKNFENYNKNTAPAVLMTKSDHAETKGVFNTFAADIRRQQGSSQVDWTQVSAEDIVTLAKDQFAAANTPAHVVEDYFKLPTVHRIC